MKRRTKIKRMDTKKTAENKDLVRLRMHGERMSFVDREIQKIDSAIDELNMERALLERLRGRIFEEAMK